MMNTQWTITLDCQAGPNDKPGTNANAAGMVGPRGATLTSEEIQNHPEAVKFRMFDDDDEEYYDGFIIVGEENEAEFMPLDNFGEPNAGCTTIEFLNKKTGEWEQI